MREKNRPASVPSVVVSAEHSRDTGDIRLLCTEDGEVTAASPWTYVSIASLVVNGVRYFAASNYWDGFFPVGKVFTVKEVE